MAPCKRRSDTLCNSRPSAIHPRRSSLGRPGDDPRPCRHCVWYLLWLLDSTSVADWWCTIMSEGRIRRTRRRRFTETQLRTYGCIMILYHTHHLRRYACDIRCSIKYVHRIGANIQGVPIAAVLIRDFREGF